MPVRYQVPESPFLVVGEGSALDLMPSPVAAARQPVNFMMRKLANLLNQENRVYQAVNERYNPFVRKLGKLTTERIPEIYEGQPMALAAEEDALQALYQSLAQDEFRRLRRLADAVDLWHLRNAGIRRAVQGSTGAKDLRAWYDQALREGPLQPKLPWERPQRGPWMSDFLEE